MKQYADVIYVTKTNDMSDEVVKQRLNKVEKKLKDYEIARVILIHQVMEDTTPEIFVKCFGYRFEDTEDEVQKIVIFDADEFYVKELDEIRKVLPADITLLTC